MPNPTTPASNDHWLRRESLELKKIINLARGAPVTDWAPDQEWTEIFQDLKDAIDRDELPAAVRGKSASRRSSVRLLDLWGFVVDRDSRWQPLRDFCQRWFTARGEEPPVPITPDGPKPTAAPGADPYRTGLPGRPTIKHLILEKFRERVGQRTFHFKVADEARELCKWAEQEHRDAAPVKRRSIENLIRDEHRRAKQAIP